MRYFYMLLSLLFALNVAAHEGHTMGKARLLLLALRLMQKAICGAPALKMILCWWIKAAI